ncbi:MAG: hypothetical protein II837_06875, partial [Treponema sp.]|nr:hypothetical protein [Treponema sp.]
MAGNYRGGQRDSVNSLPIVKADNYFRLAASEQDELVKARYEEKARYWTLKSEGADIPPELEASCGENHVQTPVDQLVNARIWLGRSKDPQKLAEWKFKVDFWTKKAHGLEVTPQEQELFNAYDAQRVEAQEAKEKSREKRGFENNSYRRTNYIKLANSLVKGTFPAFGDGKPVENGKISFVPASVRSFDSGRPYSGVNQFVMQVFAKDRGWVPEEDGNFYLATKHMVGVITDHTGKQILNLKPGAVGVHFATVGNESTRTEEFQ